MEPAIRVISIMEATFVTGPAKNLLGFAQRARDGNDGFPPISFSVATYERGAREPENKFVTAVREAGIPVDFLRERYRFDFAVIGQIERMVAERKPDIIQTHNVKSHFLMRASGLWRTYRWLAFHHGYVTTDFKMRCYNQLDRWSLRAPRHIVTVCGAFAQDLERRGIPRDRITVRHNSVTPFPPVEQSAVEAVRGSVRAPAGVPILLMMGRLSHEKGHVDLLHALGFLQRELKEDRFHLVIVGEGPERARIEAARSRLGLDDRVTLVGLQHDVRPYYACSDIAVVASHSEGSPNALLEAMIAGVPVVATRVGGIPEIVTDGETALLVEARETGEMARAIQKLLQDPECGATLARNARRTAEDQYSPEAYQRSLTALYRELAARRPKGAG